MDPKEFELPLEGSMSKFVLLHTKKIKISSNESTGAPKTEIVKKSKTVKKSSDKNYNT